MKNPITLAATLLALAASASAQTVHVLSKDERDALDTTFTQTIAEGGKAAARRDYAEAERLYRRACLVYGSDDPFAHKYLATLYDRTGQDRKAMVEYRIVLVGSQHGASSDQTDPTLLAHFGDLSDRYGNEDDARIAYALAARQSDRDANGDEPNTVPRNDTLRALKAAAHTAAALQYGAWGDRKEELQNLDLAVAADDRYWVARFYRARAYGWRNRFADGVAEARVAERLATGGDKVTVQRMRKTFHLEEPKG